MSGRSRSVPSPRERQTFIEAARRAQIVECAIETIAELGYARASLAEIAKRAGISKSVISYHFAGKDDLIHEVVDEVLHAGMRAMQPSIDAETTARGKLHAYISSNIAYMRTNHARMVAIVEIFSANRGEGDTPLVDEETALSGVRAMADILGMGQADGEFRPFAIHVMAASIRASIDFIPPQIAGYLDLDLDLYERELITLFDLATRNDG